ncbi:glycosyltransferase family 32 protein [Ligilactobacillus agilis]|uniref:glycosyltransferase family 32 protein n=1 Tax=Ligilactobacillus agilis TaxID=1601 RepID=UPI003F894094
MIPKVIHYIWLGGREEPTSVLMMINSWRRYLPDYEIRKWDETNLPMAELRKKNKFFDKCCKYKLYAFMSDYLRLWILYNYGGIYMDTDVEVIRNFNPLLDNEGFIGYEKGNSEYGEFIGTGVIGAIPRNETIYRLLDFYSENIWEEKEYVNTIIMKKSYLKNRNLFSHLKIYKREFFSPFSPYDGECNKLVDKENTYTIHWYSKNWGISRKGYSFISTKYIKSPLKRLLFKIRRNISYLIKNGRV